MLDEQYWGAVVSSQDPRYREEIEDCPVCEGAGEIKDEWDEQLIQCPECEGSGQVLMWNNIGYMRGEN